MVSTFHKAAIFVGDGAILVFRSKYDPLREKSDQQDNKQDLCFSLPETIKLALHGGTVVQAACGNITSLKSNMLPGLSH